MKKKLSVSLGGLVPKEEIDRVMKSAKESDERWKKENSYLSCNRCQHLIVTVLTYYYEDYEIGPDGFRAYDEHGKRKRLKWIVDYEGHCKLDLNVNTSERCPTKCEGRIEGIPQVIYSKAKRIKKSL